jgi:hypothetical protein
MKRKQMWMHCTNGANNRLAASVLNKKQKEMGSYMIIGAVIAGLLIISLFFEMIGSSPKPNEEHQAEARQVKSA